MMTSLFKPAVAGNTTLKQGIFGPQGTGKSTLAILIAIGLHKHMQQLGLTPPPLMYLDTETGSDWVAPLVRDAKIPELLTAKTRAFTDLKQAVAEAEQQRAILIVDSITHFWEELIGAAMKAKRRDRLELQDWQPIKKQWATFTGAFINADAHIILCGREAAVYETQIDDDTGKKSMIASGTRLAAEKGLGYEPNLVVEMEAIQKRTTKPSAKSVIRRATVLKDRGRLLDGKQFDNPTFKNFLPHINQLRLGGAHIGIDLTKSSSSLFARGEREDRGKQRAIVLDEIKDLMTLSYGQTKDDQRTKILKLRQHFGASWAEIEGVMSLERLREGYDGLHKDLTGEDSRYAIPLPEEVDDEIPEAFLAGPGEGGGGAAQPQKQRIAVKAGRAEPERPLE